MRVKPEDVFVGKVRVAHVGIFRNDGLEHLVGVGLPQHLEGELCIDGGLAHGKEKPEQLDAGIEELLDLVNRCAYLDDGVKLEVAGRDDNHNAV